ncbi:MAG TPA: FAD binding domain-containing protein [Gaiellaceae bacterium]|nr:FAD binding domain-containing protein [Gaiellaceae bacterium]
MDAFSPRSLEEALEIRAAHPEAIPVAGGTDLWVEVNARRLRPPALLDLSRVEELRRWERNGAVFVGAGTTFSSIVDELGEFGPLVEAARSVASSQIRNRATVGGNLATASPAGDSIPVLSAYGADVIAAAAGGRRRRIPLDEFLVGPKRTSLTADELIEGVEWTPVSGPGSFTKVGRRNAMVIAVASACLQLDEERGRVRLALGSVGPTVLRAAGAERFAAEILDGDRTAAALAEFGRLAASEAQPIDDLRGSAAYRRRVVEVLARRALARALEERC